MVEKTGRKAPCTCGSGKKFKHCCGQTVAESASPRLNLNAALTHAMALHQSGQLNEAASLYQQILSVKRDHPDALHLLGGVALQMGYVEAAVDLLEKAVRANSSVARYHCSLANALRESGVFDRAEKSYRRALSLQPADTESLNNLGGLLLLRGDFDGAITCLSGAVASQPDFVLAHCNLGMAQLGKQDFSGAIASFRQAIELKSDYVDAYIQLGVALQLSNEQAAGFEMLRHALSLQESRETRAALLDGAKRVSWEFADAGIRVLLARAISEPWDRPIDLSALCTRVVKLDTVLNQCLLRAEAAWPEALPASTLLGATGLASLAKDPLLMSMLESFQICDVSLEKLLTMVRRVLLCMVVSADGSLDEDGRRLLAALACQCFLNEYAYFCDADELAQVDRLAKILADSATNGDVSPDVMLAVAAYRSLGAVLELNVVSSRIWPDYLQHLLRLQVQEPAEELGLRAKMPRLTPIDDAVSIAVREQYEEHPYPRWTKMPPAGAPTRINDYLRRLFPCSDIRPLGASGQLEILVAGCGTGQQSIEAARFFRGAKVLAVDLSLTSLGFAKRKSQELGVENIDYAQADIANLGGIGRQFDVIEVGGVLHHMKDPLAGWKVLLKLLRPGGVMGVGLYSELARQSVVNARAFVGNRGYEPDAAGIRQFRRDLMLGVSESEIGQLVQFADFFSVSECRDLVFHVQEHRFTIAQLGEFFRELNLDFLGFILDDFIAQRYRTRFPEDVAMTDLGSWAVFEAENPDTFSAMYRFYVQPRGLILS